MSKIGEYRLGVYELLYQHPICNYAEVPSKNIKVQQNVLILGNGWVGNEAFKACLWAGQAINSTLNITVASQNALDYKKATLDNVERFKGISDFLGDYPDTTIDFIQFAADVELDKLEFENKRFNYIIVSLGDSNDDENGIFNYIVAEEILNKLEKITYSQKPLVAVFGKSKISHDEQKALQDSKNAETVFFDRKSVNEESDLLLLAKNINFAYSMYYDERTPLNTSDGKFIESLEEEFVRSPEDKESGNLSIADNFCGSSYNADSSYASAVHISVKLSMCNLFKSKGNTDLRPEDILSDIVLHKNDPNSNYKKNYDKLLELEHRRWYAYMAIRGYRAPSIDEEKRFLYNVKNETDHKDKTQLLHICMCRSDDQGVKLGKDVSKWSVNPYSNKNTEHLSDLDKASLRAHSLAEKASESVKNDIYDFLSGLDQTNTVISNYCRAVLKLINDDYNSIKIYKDALENTNPRKDENDNEIKLISDSNASIIKKVDGLLQVVINRNKRIDFAAIDEQLIDFMPFCLWYRKANQRVITITKGIPVKDIIIPTLFCANNATFMVSGSIGSNEKIVNEYFGKYRGHYTHVDFKRITSQKVLDNLLEEYHDELVSGKAILNLVDPDPELGIKMGQYMSTHDVTVVTYHPRKGIQCLSGNRRIGAGLDNKNLSVEEVIMLIGGERTNTLDMLSSDKEREKLVELFQKHFLKSWYDKKEHKKIELFTWNECATFLGQASKDLSNLICSDNYRIDSIDRSIKNHNGKIPVAIYNLCGLDDWFNRISQYHIITNYAKEKCDAYYTISFDYCEETLIQNVISKFECDNNTDPRSFTLRVSFTMDEGIKLYDLNVENACINIVSNESNKDYGSVEKANCLQSLCNLGFIDNLKFGELLDTSIGEYPMCKECSSKETCEKIKKSITKKVASFTFKTRRYRWLLKQQGVPFEEITYHLFHEFGAFHDVQTGVKIKWSKEQKTFEERLNEQIKNVINRFGKDKCGYYYYLEAKRAAYNQSVNENWASVENEIDIIATHGMTPIFGSCKTNKTFDNGWVYEINSISDHFGALPILIVAQNCQEKIKSAIIGRAKQMDVSMIGTETLWNDEALKAVLHDIKNGKTVSVR